MWLKDLCQLCELSLHTSLFSHMKRVFKQQRGSAIGNQISPSLANIAASYLEHQWFFCRHPVELEDVTNGKFLGTILDASLRTLSFQQPVASFQFRPFRSEGTEAHKLSAAAARICPASRYSFPDHQARSDVQQLVRSYLEYDYPATKLKQLADKFLKARC